MRKHLVVLLTAAASFSATDALALNSHDQQLIDSMTLGSAGSLRNAAKSIYRGSSRDELVLDTLAEKTLQLSPSANDNTSVDAISWGCKALGQSGNKRYYTALMTMAQDDSVHRKARKYCKKSANQLGRAEGEQYQRGDSKLKKQASVSRPAKPKPKPKTASGNNQPITAVTNGMGMSEVYALIGTPTSTYTHQTGKAWIPFNFKGGDLARTVALYQGQGRVVFSNTNRYSGQMVVLEVIVDPNESGYQ
ncbi:hypothetical protein KOI40_01580 [Aestuariicella sp. G3-2]|uniref:hypothetical protein n=1 Tax=Pseudomaricurvus albidus TaxID=2842452 RepID=UPI001C0B567A|nr:hypothetical protein [Aestuariicella albida]MBU3068486.1 hypothetical protein [Aestuariicella albida]